MTNLSDGREFSFESSNEMSDSHSAGKPETHLSRSCKDAETHNRPQGSADNYSGHSCGGTMERRHSIHDRSESRNTYGMEQSESTVSGSTDSASYSSDRQECKSRTTGLCGTVTGNSDEVPNARTSAEQQSVDLGQRIFQRFYATTDASKRWLSDIFPYGSSEDAVRVVRAAAELAPSETRGFVAIYHAETESTGHFHFYHACTFSSSHCRCSWFNKITSVIGNRGDAENGGRQRRRIKARFGRKVIYCKEITAVYWRNFLQYFSQAGRKILHLEIGGTSYLPEINRYSSVRGSEEVEEGEQSEEHLAACDISCEISNWKSIKSEAGQGDQSSSQESNSTTSEGSERVSKSKGGSSRVQCGPVPKKLRGKLLDHRFVMDALRNFVCVPIDSTCELHAWLSDETLSFYDKTDTDYKRAVNLYRREVSLLSFREITQLILNAQYASFLSRSGDHYATISESLTMVESLLEFQYGNNDAVMFFMNRLYNVCERTLKKTNSMFIIGPPNSGKTWFTDMVASFYINVGYVGNFNKSNAFPLNDCVNRRILIWNEPNIEQCAYDTVKMLCGGDACPCNVKYQPGSTVTRTPLIFTSNKNVFNSGDAVWNSRVYFEGEWKSASLLSGYTKYPHPATYILLIAKYVYPFDAELQNYVKLLMSKFE